MRPFTPSQRKWVTEESLIEVALECHPTGLRIVRGVAIAFFLLPINAYWIGVTEGLWHALHMTTLSLPMNALVLLISLALLNRLIKMLHPRLALSHSELLLIHTGLTVQSVLIGHDQVVSLMGVIPAAAWFENPTNRWQELFFQHIPKWLAITDKRVAWHFYTGGGKFYGSGYESHWLMPALSWTGLMTSLFVAYTSSALLLYCRWAHQEKLGFPITRIPMEIVTERLSWRSSLFWWGFIAAAFVDMINHLHHLYPSVPFIKVRARDRDLMHFVTEPPWTALGSTPLALYPFIIGYSYLMPLDVCASAWLFYLLRKLQRLFGMILGLMRLPRFPYENEQASGAALAIAILALWRMRDTIIGLVVPSRSPTSQAQHKCGFQRSSRIALISFAIALLVCLFISIRAGLSLPIAISFWVLHFLISTAVTRLRAEAGPPSHSLLFANPQDLMLIWLGSRSFRPRELTALALFFWFNRLNRNHPMPVAIEAIRMGEIIKVPIWFVCALIVFMGLMTMALCFGLYPVLFYSHGATRVVGEVVWVGMDTFNRLASWIGTPSQPNVFSRCAVAFGLTFTLMLNFLYHRMPWWGLHPLGYLLGTSYAIDFYWLCLLIGSTVKWLLLRYAGSYSALAATPFFIGLILGEGIVACAWSVYGIIIQKPMYDAWW
ncbi:MAG: DUF6785 family protein [Armatimonadota bacterium]|nr:hypothetical protein [Armatimonadota bacterium]MCX7776606.1 hypothetical protein [Armatimonadota bacterium]MDW8025251.1 DUF6785 family protein [Armatimonadota bacterium]